jgi:cell division protein FtsL
MKKKIFCVLASALIMMSVISCVSAKKYRELQTVNRQAMMERDDFKAENIKLQMLNRELENKASALGNEMEEMKYRLSVAEIERNKARMNSKSFRKG